MILNLAVWFALRTLFLEMHPVPLGPLRLDLPVPGSLALWALVLTLAAILAVFRLRMSVLPVLSACAAAGAVLRLSGLA